MIIEFFEMTNEWLSPYLLLLTTTAKKITTPKVENMFKDIDIKIAYKLEKTLKNSKKCTE